MTDIHARPVALGAIGGTIDRAVVAIRSKGDIDVIALERASNAVWELRSTLMHEERAAQNAREQAARVAERMKQVWDHIEAMRAERQGWGEDAQRGIDTTVMSWARARALYLDTADEVWIDGGVGFSFGGTISGIVFGCIARPAVERGFAPEDGWAYPTYEWTFHS